MQQQPWQPDDVAGEAARGEDVGVLVTPRESDILTFVQVRAF